VGINNCQPEQCCFPSG